MRATMSLVPAGSNVSPRLLRSRCEAELVIESFSGRVDVQRTLIDTSGFLMRPRRVKGCPDPLDGEKILSVQCLAWRCCARQIAFLKESPLVKVEQVLARSLQGM